MLVLLRPQERRPDAQAPYALGVRTRIDVEFGKYLVWEFDCDHLGDDQVDSELPGE